MKFLTLGRYRILYNKPIIGKVHHIVYRKGSSHRLFLFVELGPAKVIHVYEPSVGLKAVLMVDNVARGPAIGGLRIAPDVSPKECLRLARAMTLKNAAADLPHGGGKSVIYGDPKMPTKEKETLIRAMASSLREIQEYIFAPDMGTDEECMAWVKDEIGRAVGLPTDFGAVGKHTARFLTEKECSAFPILSPMRVV
jgi:hypothetical protein